MNALIVILGAGLGGGVRHGVNLAVARLAPQLDFPLATLIINVLGSFLMGVLAEAFVMRGAGGHPLKLFLTTGMLGGFTTFSTFSLDAVTLYDRGEVAAAGFYVLASVVAALLGLIAGLALARTLLGGGVS
ncbi:fluoride efflux transporter CrcB [Methylobacterium haplocladii]|uniref:Fluoride-specific ion channel FluC n=1 Tax=Methylobacterium haplocladii TaxID=1176176 RepID=A0A512INN4_9HYPH|nr:fluoride efflux transporter CrcB [Methylobacterium haplocladii]GEO99262.1 putative fluoride ion transporter CrcB [Methylobacterium haplocladii]GJD83537.1 Putative fluoride ion transporter CrcB [Methylobacterium haplocladii]GLS60312.1 putative fluoride ion transporter CrcB [Methylobacterium haplocladii]